MPLTCATHLFQVETEPKMFTEGGIENFQRTVEQEGEGRGEGYEQGGDLKKEAGKLFQTMWILGTDT